ncbi:RiPP maturation radical SAM C-methyltransferase [Actinophytocola sediminis]
MAFVNMPFADWNRPSFALSQLASMLRRDFADRVTVGVHYLNQDIADYLGVELYESISVSHDHVDTGLGDWLFRGIAFPDAPDTAEDYFRRFYPGRRWAGFRRDILRLRAGLRERCGELIDRYRIAEADLVGFSSMFAQHVPTIAAASLVKERSPGTLTVVGGANCEAPMGSVIAEYVPEVDFLFSGPALDTFAELVRHALDGDPEAADTVPGIVSRRNCQVPRFRRAIGRDHDIDDVMTPDYDSFVAALDAHPSLRETGTSEPMLFFETSRGCWWGERSHCTFCGLNGQSMGYRAMAADAAVEQFDWLFGFAPEYPQLFCTDNVMPRNYPRDVFERLDPPPEVSIFYEVKLPLSRRDLGRMAAAGVTVVQPGIEALATSTLKLMGKGTTSFQNLQFLKNCEEFGIEPKWNLLIGFPGEDELVYRRYAEILPLLTHLRPPNGVYMVRFDRFSPYFTRREEFGLDLHPMDFYPLTYPFPADALEQLAYFFADHNLAPYMLNAVRWHDRLRGLVSDWRDAWYGDRPVPRELRLSGSDEAGWAVRDSRDGRAAVHPVDAPTAAFLRDLASPAKLAQVADERVDWLRDNGMLFEEDGRLLSLVLTDTAEDAPPEDQDELAAGRKVLPLVSGGLR